MRETFRRYLPSIVGILIALGAAIFLRQALRPALASLDADLRVLLQLGIKWIIILILLGIVLLWEREPLSSIGIRRMHRQDVLWAFVGFLIAGALISGTIPLLKALGIGTTEAGVRR